MIAPFCNLDDILITTMIALVPPLIGRPNSHILHYALHTSSFFLPCLLSLFLSSHEFHIHLCFLNPVNTNNLARSGTILPCLYSSARRRSGRVIPTTTHILARPGRIISGISVVLPCRTLLVLVALYFNQTSCVF